MKKTVGVSYYSGRSSNTPSDILEVVVIYVMLNNMAFLVGEDARGGEDASRHILRRHTSLFGDEDGFRGLLQYIGEENPLFEPLIALARDFDGLRPREPFAMWHYVDATFRDLVVGMTNLNPEKRLTAREALLHPWFRQEE